MKSKNYGFTLIEILVVIVISGILAAIALPAFLTQTNKAREVEPVIYLNSALKAQQEKYIQSGEFIESWADLNLSTLEVTENYTYRVINLKDNNQLTAGMFAQPNKPDLKALLAGIEPVIKDDVLIFVSVICQAKSTGNQFTENTLIKVRKLKMKCTSNSTEIGK